MSINIILMLSLSNLQLPFHPHTDSLFSVHLLAMQQREEGGRMFGHELPEIPVIDFTTPEEEVEDQNQHQVLYSYN